ncbi:MAG: C10 family peptidase [Tannerellaceae bacterium]|jgi:hypothetical protein|nr:C10 family peptidase [Tannerellaceae bacterium]
MRKFFSLFFLGFALFVIGCTGESDLSNGQVNNLEEPLFTEAELKVLYQMRNEDYKVSVEEATKFAGEVITFLDGTSVVKSGRSRNIRSVVPVRWENKPVTLRSMSEADIEYPDTVVYIFNFGEEDGYAIVAADTRIDASVLAYTGSGSLGVETDNPGLGLFLEGAENYIQRSIVEAEQRKDSLMDDIIAKLESETDTKPLYTKREDPMYSLEAVETKILGEIETVNHVSPLSRVEWGQGDARNEPFWRNVRYNNCTSGTSPAGCVAVAVAHIMSYWKYPTSIDGKSFNWTELNKYTSFPSITRTNRYKNWIQEIDYAPEEIKTQAANLMESIGSKVGMEYGCNGSGAFSENAISYLKSINYGGGDKSDYDYNKVKSSLNNERPVYIDGYAYKTTYKHAHKFLGITLYYTYSTSYSGGHAWIIDGYLEQQQPITITTRMVNTATGEVVRSSTSTTYIYTNYLHNNWGWHGYDNGYYAEGCFNSNLQPLASNTKSGEAYNFQYLISIWPNIYK